MSHLHESQSIDSWTQYENHGYITLAWMKHCDTFRQPYALGRATGDETINERKQTNNRLYFEPVFILHGHSILGTHAQSYDH